MCVAVVIMHGAQGTAPHVVHCTQGFWLMWSFSQKGSLHPWSSRSFKVTTEYSII